ncbi:multiprotein-bridging factor 1 family protein [Aestuariivirga sp.]|uniref:helix-turn-helix domain-containing protein n=1 Tax=Aestuariivirga sp. TaxID=2650926 RepID=UPI003594044B
MTQGQCRAARALLDWSQSDLARAAHVSISTVRDFESGLRTPIANNISALQRALESKGIVFRSGSKLGIEWIPSLDTAK